MSLAKGIHSLSGADLFDKALSKGKILHIVSVNLLLHVSWGVPIFRLPLIQATARIFLGVSFLLPSLLFQCIQLSSSLWKHRSRGWNTVGFWLLCFLGVFLWLVASWSWGFYGLLRGESLRVCLCFFLSSSRFHFHTPIVAHLGSMPRRSDILFYIFAVEESSGCTHQGFGFLNSGLNFGIFV